MSEKEVKNRQHERGGEKEKNQNAPGGKKGL